jgi:hypothetical protein
MVRRRRCSDGAQKRQVLCASRVAVRSLTVLSPVHGALGWQLQLIWRDGVMAAHAAQGRDARQVLAAPAAAGAVCSGLHA